MLYFKKKIKLKIIKTVPLSLIKKIIVVKSKHRNKIKKINQNKSMLSEFEMSSSIRIVFDSSKLIKFY